MALQFMDNFQQYGTDETLLTDGIYATATGILSTNPDGVTGDIVWRTSEAGNGADDLRRVLSSSQTTVGVAFRMWNNNLPSGSGSVFCFLRFNDFNNTPQTGLVLETTGAISAYRGTTLLGRTAGPVITAGAWSHIECKVLFSQTVGTVEVRVNGVPVLNLTGQDTCNTANVECSQVELTNAAGSNGITSGSDNNGSWYLKDLIIWDGSGTVNNDFVGDCQVVSLIPNGDDTLNWATSTGTTGYNLIDETTVNDADYISADSTPPAASVFTLTDLDPEVVTVKGLMTFCRAFKTDGGTANLQVSLVSGASTDNGADRPITTTATTWSDISELDPATAAAWTPIAVNAAKLKIDRTV